MFPNPLKIIKMAKDPEMLTGLGNFHNALVLHLAFLNTKKGADDFDVEFLARGREYIEFLNKMGMPIEIPYVAPETVPK